MAQRRRLKIPGDCCSSFIIRHQSVVWKKKFSNSKAPPKNSLNAQRAPCLEREKVFSGLGGTFIGEVP